MTHLRAASEADGDRCVEVALTALAPTYRSAVEAYGEDLGERLTTGWQVTVSDLVRGLCVPGEHRTTVAELDGERQTHVAESV